MGQRKSELAPLRRMGWEGWVSILTLSYIAENRRKRLCCSILHLPSEAPRRRTRGGEYELVSWNKVLAAMVISFLPSIVLFYDWISSRPGLELLRPLLPFPKCWIATLNSCDTGDGIQSFPPYSSLLIAEADPNKE